MTTATATEPTQAKPAVKPSIPIEAKPVPDKRMFVGAYVAVKMLVLDSIDFWILRQIASGISKGTDLNSLEAQIVGRVNQVFALIRVMLDLQHDSINVCRRHLNAYVPKWVSNDSDSLVQDALLQCNAKECVKAFKEAVDSPKDSHRVIEELMRD